jgi:hypothetical protein
MILWGTYYIDINRNIDFCNRTQRTNMSVTSDLQNVSSSSALLLWAQFKFRSSLYIYNIFCGDGPYPADNCISFIRAAALAALCTSPYWLSIYRNQVNISDINTSRKFINDLLIYLFSVYLMTLSIGAIIQGWKIGWSLDITFEEMWIVAWLHLYLPRISEE